MSTNPGWAPFRPTLQPDRGWSDRGSRPDLNVTATLGGVTLTSRHGPVGDYAFRLQTVEGWEDPAPDATRTMQHPTGDGDVPLQSRLGVRSIELAGYISARESPAPMLARATQVLRRARRGVLVIDEHDLGQRLEADVRLSKATIRRVTAGFARFSMLLVADDPLRYGTGSIDLAAGANVIPNLGDARAYSQVTFVGPLTTPSITVGGVTWTLNRTLTAGQTRVADMREGVVWAGQARDHGASSGRVPTVAPGGSTWTRGGSGSGKITVRRYEAWT